ncbi:MAG: hypothetical protein OIN89_09410 [Candidatus Methanoperedens sp.]|jgi:hypothetical protein|nr:hypothetical protein [Candidatus Methanoperedens sp.]
MSGKRKTFHERCPVCGGDDLPLDHETIFYDDLEPDIPVYAEVSPGRWIKVVERKPART